MRDRVYLTKDATQVASVKLPCGTKAHFILHDPAIWPEREARSPRE